MKITREEAKNRFWHERKEHNHNEIVDIIFDMYEENTKALDTNIDHKILASYFNRTNEAMRQLKRKYEESQTGLWIIYIKAYNFDLSEFQK